MIDWIVLILLILLLFVSSILIGYFFLLILERLLGCIGVFILGVVIVLVLLFWLGTLVLKEGTEAGPPGVILLGGIEMSVWLHALLATVFVMIVFFLLFKIIDWIFRSKRPSLYMGIFIFLLTYSLFVIVMSLT